MLLRLRISSSKYVQNQRKKKIKAVIYSNNLCLTSVLHVYVSTACLLLYPNRLALPIQRFSWFPEPARVKKSALGFRKPDLRFKMVPKKILLKCTKFEINYLLI